MGGRGSKGGAAVAARKTEPKADHLADLNAHERKIALAYERLAPSQYAFVDVTKLRAAAGLSRADFDAAAVGLQRKEGFTFNAEVNQKTLTAADHRDAVRIGNQNRHTFVSSRERN